MKRVLILLSSYNGEDFIKEQLDSLALQEGVDVSVLVRDDGSKDSTISIINQYKRKINIELIEGDNVGSVRSFLYLINSCSDSYDYYAFCDQDDYWDKDKLDVAVSKLEQYDSFKPALYYSSQTLTDDKLKPVYEHILDTRRNILSNCIFNQTAGCTAVFNKELLLKMRAKEQNDLSPGFHDSCLYKVCAMCGGTIICDHISKIKYRQHSNNVIGLNYSVKGKIIKFFNYLKPSELRYDLAYIFENLNISTSDNDIQIFLKHIYDSNKEIGAKSWLLSHQNKLYFHSLALRMIFIYKVLFSKF